MKLSTYVYVRWVFWSFLCYSDPNQHPFIGEKEHKYLNDNVTGLKEQDNEKEVRIVCHFLFPLCNFSLHCTLKVENRNACGGFTLQHVKTPWKAMLTSLPVLALITTEVGHDWGFYTMITDLPKFMNDVLHFKIQNVSTARSAVERGGA